MPKFVPPDAVGLAAQPTVDALDARQFAVVISLNRQHHGVRCGHDMNLVWVFAIQLLDQFFEGDILLLVHAGESFSTQLGLTFGRWVHLAQ